MTGRRMVNKGSSVEKIMQSMKVIDREIVKRKNIYTLRYY